jgi:hypothetical protein
VFWVINIGALSIVPGQWSLGSIRSQLTAA